MAGRRIALAFGPLLVAVTLFADGALGRPATTRGQGIEGDEPPARRDRDAGLLDDDLGLEGDDDPRMRERRRRGVNSDDWFRNPFRYEDERDRALGDFPSAHVHDAVIANARAAAARAVFRRAESALDTAVRNAKRSFEASGDYRKAQEEQRQAYQAYQDARRQALGMLGENPLYQSLMRLREELSQQIAMKRRGLQDNDTGPGGSFMSEIIAMATLKMSYGAQARQMEQDAFGDDAGLRESLQKYQDASRRVAELRGQFDESIRNDPDLVAARQALADARIAKLTTAAYLKGALAAANEALDFAYYLHRYDGSSAYSDFRYYYPYGDYRSRYLIGYGN